MKDTRGYGNGRQHMIARAHRDHHGDNGQRFEIHRTECQHREDKDEKKDGTHSRETAAAMPPLSYRIGLILRPCRMTVWIFENSVNPILHRRDDEFRRTLPGDQAPFPVDRSKLARSTV